MEKVDKLYSEFHAGRLGIHCYPNEFLVRTMLGRYPGLKLEHNYEGKNALDWACGDGRNMGLLHNLGLKVHGFEITEDICNGVSDRMQSMGIEADIRVGRNTQVPFQAEYFDYVVASSSLYYVDHGSSFKENLKELTRVLKSDGYVIATLAHPQTFILDGAVEQEDSHYQIVNDPYGLRNGDIFKVFHTKEQILETFGADYGDISIGMQNEDYYGMHIQMWLVVMKKKVRGDNESE